MPTSDPGARPGGPPRPDPKVDARARRAPIGRQAGGLRRDLDRPPRERGASEAEWGALAADPGARRPRARRPAGSPRKGDLGKAAVRPDPGEAGDAPALSAREERELAGWIAVGDPEARDRMVRANLGLVVAIARRFPRRAVPLEDLVAEGNLGLLRAVEAFDPDAGARFSTYAAFWIREAIRRAWMNQADVVRRPAHAHKLLAKWHRASAALAQELGREPTTEEVGGALGLGPRRLRIAEDALRAATMAPDGGGPGETIAGRVPDPAEAAEEAEALGRLRERLDGLGAREAAVLRLRFGLGEEGPMTLSEVGRRLGLSRESVRLAEMRALRRLSTALADP